MLILCDRCIRGLKSHSGNIIVGDVINDSAETCEYCETADSDLYKVIFISNSDE
jgi:hypothetical protein